MRMLTINNHRRGRKRTLFRMTCGVLVFLILLVFLDMQMRPSVKKMAATQAKLYAVQAINDAVSEELADKNVTYQNLVQLSVHKDGTITAIETNMVSLNRLKANITDAVVQRLNRLKSEELDIPIGTLFGGQFFSGRGPLMNFHILNTGFVQSEIISRFESAGINQTCHQIVLSITVNITALVPGFSAATVATTNMCLAETVIVGTVPNSFTKVTGDERDELSKLYDYRPKNAGNS